MRAVVVLPSLDWTPTNCGLWVEARVDTGRIIAPLKGLVNNMGHCRAIQNICVDDHFLYQ